MYISSLNISTYTEIKLSLQKTCPSRLVSSAPSLRITWLVFLVYVVKMITHSGWLQAPMDPFWLWPFHMGKFFFFHGKFTLPGPVFTAWKFQFLFPSQQGALVALLLNLCLPQRSHFRGLPLFSECIYCSLNSIFPLADRLHLLK